MAAVPPNSTAVGVPARIICRKKQLDPAEELDQVHIPDPVSQELCRLHGEIELLEKKIAEMSRNGSFEKAEGATANKEKDKEKNETV